MNKKNDIEPFEKRLKNALERNNPKSFSENDEPTGGFVRAFQIGLELFVAVVVGAAIGYFIDKQANTYPMFFIIFFFLGCAAGFLNLYRFVKNLGYDIGYIFNKQEDKGDSGSSKTR